MSQRGGRGFSWWACPFESGVWGSKRAGLSRWACPFSHGGRGYEGSGFIPVGWAGFTAVGVASLTWWAGLFQHLPRPRLLQFPAPLGRDLVQADPVVARTADFGVNSDHFGVFWG